MMNDERVFLHDLAGALGIAFFLTDSVIESLSPRQELAEELDQLKRSYQALEKVKLLLQKRRETLLKREDDSKK